MDRRQFLHTSLLTGAVTATLRTEAAARQAAAAATHPATELEEATIASLQQGLSSGALTARALAEAYLERISAIDRNGPALRSVIEVNPDAVAIAERLDAERRAGKVRGPLHGIPVLVKDNLDTADRMMTTAGSLALEGPAPSGDSFVVARLREAGAVLLGKTNLSEWANFRSTRSTSGWSARGGLTKNPYALDRNPCGSSSGSGVATSANLCVAAIGTETDGSIVCPSSANGIVGIKPTVGLVSRSGIVPISATQDTAGPMARTVADAAIVLAAIRGVDPRDPATSVGARQQAVDYPSLLDRGGLQRMRIGVTRKLAGVSDRVEQVYAEAIAAMAEAGAILVDPVELPTAAALDGPEFELLLFEFKTGLNTYLKTRAGTAVSSLTELIAFNEAQRDRELKHFGQEILERSEEKGPLTSPAYRTAWRKCRQLSRTLGIDAVMTKRTLDAIVAPTDGPAWLTDLVNGDHFSGGSSTPAAVAGYPSVTVPMGFVSGLPVGISFFGRAWSEPSLITMAYAFEQATRVRTPPRFVPTIDSGA